MFVHFNNLTDISAKSDNHLHDFKHFKWAYSSASFLRNSAVSLHIKRASAGHIKHSNTLSDGKGDNLGEPGGRNVQTRLEFFDW